MDKLFGATVAAAAATVLLVGGAGTFALWNDSTGVDAGTVTAGTLTLTPDVTTAQWRNVTTSADIPDITKFLIVPGDTLTFDEDLKIKARGDDLKAELGTDLSKITSGVGGVAPTVLEISSVSSNADVVGDTVTLTGPGDAIVHVKLTVGYPFTTNDDNADQGQKIDFSELAFVLTQLDPNPAP